MRRPHLLALIAIGAILFLALSALLARVFSVDGAERTAVTALVQAEARGDAAAMTSQLHGCAEGGACGARARLLARDLRRPGAVSILQINSSAGFSLSQTTGTARVAWRAGSSLPIVQCIRVRRAGNAISGWRIELLALSVRIKTDADCPPRY